MVKVYLGDLPFGKGPEAVRWLADRYGSGRVESGDRPTWYLEDLAYVVFERDIDATFFMLKWSGR